MSLETGFGFISLEVDSNEIETRSNVVKVIHSFALKLYSILAESSRLYDPNSVLAILQFPQPNRISFHQVEGRPRGSTHRFLLTFNTYVRASFMHPSDSITVAVRSGKYGTA